MPCARVLKASAQIRAQPSPTSSIILALTDGKLELYVHDLTVKEVSEVPQTGRRLPPADGVPPAGAVLCPPFDRQANEARKYGARIYCVGVKDFDEQQVRTRAAQRLPATGGGQDSASLTARNPHGFAPAEPGEGWRLEKDVCVSGNDIKDTRKPAFFTPSPTKITFKFLRWIFTLGRAGVAARAQICSTLMCVCVRV